MKHIAELTRGITELKEDLRKVETSVIHIKNDHGDKLKVLFDAHESQIDVNERIFEALKRIEGKVDRIFTRVSIHEDLLKK